MLTFQAANTKNISCVYGASGLVGWVRIEHAVYDFVNGQDNAFLGGAE